jgi:hypothetical protein
MARPDRRKRDQEIRLVGLPKCSFQCPCGVRQAIGSMPSYTRSQPLTMHPFSRVSSMDGKQDIELVCVIISAQRHYHRPNTSQECLVHDSANLRTY